MITAAQLSIISKPIPRSARGDTRALLMARKKTHALPIDERERFEAALEQMATDLWDLEVE